MFKKWLPSLLPLLSTAAVAIVPQLQAFLIEFVKTHPAWASVVATGGLIFNHWLPSPTSTPSDSTVGKIGSGIGGSLTALMLCFALIALTGCSSLERQAYNIIVGSKAFTQNISAKHPECGTRDVNGIWQSAHNSAGVCSAIDKGIAAKDLLIDAAEAYCAGADFETGGACNVPTSKTLKDQLAAKVQAAIQGYEQSETDIRALIK